ncbi:MAG: M48 family metallopeptidase [Candidatus Omnitrophota bacterium]
MSRCVLALTSLCFLCGCATIYNPATERNEFILITTPAEVSLGKALSGKISKDYPISKDTDNNARLKRIGEKIVSVSDRKDLTYKFFVIDNEELNAFTTPGGYIYVHSGVLKEATDDELACVIAHEAGHVAARHIAKKLQAQIGYDILMNIASRKARLAEFQNAVSISYNLMSLGYSREDETLSDKIGVKYAYKTGYDPYAMISFLEKLQKEDKDNLGIVFLRSHPYTSQRIELLKKEIPGIIEKIEAKDAGKKSLLPIDKTIEAKNTANKNTPYKKVMCNKCRRIFDSKTVYCPYCGVRLR